MAGTIQTSPDGRDKPAWTSIHAGPWWYGTAGVHGGLEYVAEGVTDRAGLAESAPGELISVRAGLHTVFTASARGLHKAVPGWVARQKLSSSWTR